MVPCRCRGPCGRDPGGRRAHVRQREIETVENAFIRQNRLNEERRHPIRHALQTRISDFTQRLSAETGLDLDFVTNRQRARTDGRGRGAPGRGRNAIRGKAGSLAEGGISPTADLFLAASSILRPV